MSAVGILLAAGRGRRFDPSGVQDKLLQTLPGGAGDSAGVSVSAGIGASAGAGPGAGAGVANACTGAGDLVVVASARILLSVLPRVVAVVRPGDSRVGAALAALGCDVTVCPDADLGMAASLVHAIRYTRDAAVWMVALGDMPHVQAGTVRALLAAIAAGADIAAPTYLGRRGNPVAFSRTHLHLLLALQGDQGARSILKTHPVAELAVADLVVVPDIDTRADLVSFPGKVMHV